MESRYARKEETHMEKERQEGKLALARLKGLALQNFARKSCHQSHLPASPVAPCIEVSWQPPRKSSVAVMLAFLADFLSQVTSGTRSWDSELFLKFKRKPQVAVCI